MDELTLAIGIVRETISRAESVLCVRAIGCPAHHFGTDDSRALCKTGPQTGGREGPLSRRRIGCSQRHLTLASSADLIVATFVSIIRYFDGILQLSFSGSCKRC